MRASEVVVCHSANYVQSVYCREAVEEVVERIAVGLRDEAHAAAIDSMQAVDSSFFHSQK